MSVHSLGLDFLNVDDFLNITRQIFLAALDRAQSCCLSVEGAIARLRMAIDTPLVVLVRRLKGIEITDG
jgi:hypothetical protein